MRSNSIAVVLLLIAAIGCEPTITNEIQSVESVIVNDETGKVGDVLPPIKIDDDHSTSLTANEPEPATTEFTGRVDATEAPGSRSAKCKICKLLKNGLSRRI